jgi:hypothetical protein
MTEMPGRRISDNAGQLTKQGYIRIGGGVPDFTVETSQGADQLSRVHPGFLVRALLPSRGFSRRYVRKSTKRRKT